MCALCQVGLVGCRQPASRGQSLAWTIEVPVHEHISCKSACELEGRATMVEMSSMSSAGPFRTCPAFRSDSR